MTCQNLQGFFDHGAGLLITSEGRHLLDEHGVGLKRESCDEDGGNPNIGTGLAGTSYERDITSLIEGLPTQTFGRVEHHPGDPQAVAGIVRSWALRRQAGISPWNPA